MRLAYLCDVDLSEDGAAAVHVLSVAEHAKVLGADIRVYGPQPARAIPLSSVDIRLVRKSRTPLIRTLFYNIALTLRCWREMRCRKPAAVYARMSPMFFAPIAVRCLVRVPLIVEVNGPLQKELAHGNVRKPVRMLNLGYEICLYRSSSRVIAVTDKVRRNVSAYLREGDDRVHVIPNGVDIDLFKPLRRQEHGGFRIGYVGSLLDWQGVDYLIEAMTSVTLQVPGSELVVVGDGSARASLEDLARSLGVEQRVVFQGSMKHTELPATIATFDLCVCYPSAFRSGDTSPMKLYEYMACGKAVVASRIEGLTGNLDGLVAFAEPDSPESLASCIVSLARDSELRHGLERKSRAYVVDNASWLRVADRILRQIESVTR
jgi:starch synthase